MAPLPCGTLYACLVSAEQQCRERTPPLIWRRPDQGPFRRNIIWPRRKEWHMSIVGSKARYPLGQQDNALTAWGSQEAGDRALLYGRSTGAKALSPAPRNAAAVLIRSLPGSWRPRGLWTRSPAPPRLAGLASVSLCPTEHARRSWPRKATGAAGAAPVRGARVSSKRVLAAQQPLPGLRTRPGRSPAPPNRAAPGPASALQAPPLLNHLEEKNYYRIRCTSARWFPPFPSA